MNVVEHLSEYINSPADISRLRILEPQVVKAQAEEIRNEMRLQFATNHHLRKLDDYSLVAIWMIGFKQGAVFGADQAKLSVQNLLNRDPVDYKRQSHLRQPRPPKPGSVA